VPRLSIEFGYYPYPCSTQWGPISITTLPDLEGTIASVDVAPTIYENWLYAPPQVLDDPFSGKQRILPYASRIFGLPKTHVLTHSSADSTEHLEFLVWCIGFFSGMRLTTVQAGFLDATPLKAGSLTDFVMSEPELPRAIELSEVFWQSHSPDSRKIKCMEGIIHALFLAQYPRYLQFEEFMYLYTALDACFALTKSIFSPVASASHAHRIHWMCQQFGLATPSWAQPVKQGTEVSLVRNESFHEALFFEEPLGFQIYGGSQSHTAGSVPLEMLALICRLVVALLGRPYCSYVRSSIHTRERFSLRFDRTADLVQKNRGSQI
jgi:hypothetical protein